ncbi:hypothetical protein [Streptomyces cucumeris]|uniref:hypothetical protein n=1 Tax=Streptomyces cucumeris TaxID=2962890 RepID=UPI003D74FC21
MAIGKQQDEWVTITANIGSACSVTVTEKDVQHRSILGRTRRIPRRDIATVLYAPRLNTGNNQHGDWLVLLDEHDRPLLRLTSHYIWSHEGIKQVCEAVGGPTVNMPDTQARVVGLHYPKAMPYRTAHPNIFGGIIAALLVAVIVVGVIAVEADSFP